MYSNTEAVVFDMDGLMIDSERVIKLCWDRAGEALGFGPLGFHMPYTMGLNREDREQYFKRKYGDVFPFDTFLETYKRAYRDYEQAYGIDPNPGLYDALEALKEKNCKLAVATSSSEVHATRILQNLKVADYFDAAVYGSMVKRSKPDPQIYTLAVQKLGIMPERAVALEDSFNGIRSAYAAGLKPVMIPDLITDSSPVDGLLYAKYNNLKEFAEAFCSTADEMTTLP